MRHVSNFFSFMSPGAPRDGYLLMVGTKAVGVWKEVPFKVTVKGQDHESDFTPFVWLNAERGNQVANLVEATGFTVGDGGYLRFPRKLSSSGFLPNWMAFFLHARSGRKIHDPFAPVPILILMNWDLLRFYLHVQICMVLPVFLQESCKV